jgi:hypothetical protein
MWKELGLDSVKKGLDNFVKRVVVEDDVKSAVPRDTETGQYVAYALRDGGEVNLANFPERDSDLEFSIFQIPVVGRPLLVSEIKQYFPIKSASVIFRFKIQDDVFGHVFLDGLRDDDIAPTFRGSVVMEVLRCPVTVSKASISRVAQVKPVVSAPPPNREELVRQRLEAEAAQVRAARKFAANNAQEETNRRQEKLVAQNQLGTVMDRWALTEQGKYKDVRSLLSSMNTVLWSESGWVDVPLGELMTNEAVVKKTYRKAIVLTHPDRHQKESAEQQYRADRIFNAINESYKVFTSSG